MTGSIARVEAITREIRSCFNRLKALGDALHAGRGVSAAMRAVMESLDAGGEQTVPQVARAKRVSRQHIQVIVNGLLEIGLVSSRPNPADARSPLVALTRRGKAAFAEGRNLEKKVLGEFAARLAQHDLQATLATLASLHRLLDLRLEDAAERESDD